jgi:hypothetical protein
MRFALPIDGVTTGGSKSCTLRSGSYRATISVLKGLGDPANPAQPRLGPH